MNENSQQIKAVYIRLFHSGLSLTKIKDAVIGGRLLDHKSNGVPGRSLAWKLFLIPAEPLESTTPPHPPIEYLQSSRKLYTNMLMEKMRAPDGSYEEGFLIPGSATSPPKPVGKSAGSLEKNNPLSLHDENPWTEWFASVELRKTILQDVERTFPDIEYFRDVDVQAQLTNILYLYSVMHPALGYRQGMHELLAPLYYAIDYDSEPDDNSPEDPVFSEFCSRNWVAADAWALLDIIMQGAGRWYEFREWNDALKSLHSSSQPLNGQMELKNYVAPIVETCHRIQSTLLKSVDPSLWKQMKAAGIEPQIYGIRWLRLLFTREFGMNESMVLWDGLFACDPTFDLAPWICVAMLIRIRNRLIPADYSGQLTYLLHYPSIPPSRDPTNTIHHATLLLRQALALQISPTTSTGASIVIENRNLLSIPDEVPDPPPAPIRRTKLGEQRYPSAASNSRIGFDTRFAHTPQQSSPPMGLPEMLARGLIERSESLGINKTLMSAVSELRRNLPDLASSLVRSPTSSSASYTAFPLVDERPPEERPPWEPRTRFEMEKDILEIRSRDQLLGESIATIVDVLLQDEDGVKNDPDKLKSIQTKKREALESLSYVRDVLRGNLTEVDEERLVGEEEYRKRKLQKAGPSWEKIQDTTAVEVPRPAASASLSIPRVNAPIQNSSFPSVGPRSTQGIHQNFSQIPSTSVNPHPTKPLAPWNHTRSSFSETNSPVTVPPRTSTVRVHRLSPTPPEFFSSSGLQTGRKKRVEHDPLGALP